jgi:heptosyltransferase-2
MRASEAPTKAMIDPTGTRKILILKWSALGDIAVSSAVIADICSHFKNAAIDVHTLPSGAFFFQGDPRFNDVLTIDVRARGKRIANSIEWLRTVGSRRYDAIFDLQSADRSKFLLALLRWTGASPRHIFGWKGGFPYTCSPTRWQPGTSAIAQQRRMLQLAGVPTSTDRPVVFATSEDEAQAKAIVDRHRLHQLRFAVLLPGSQAHWKLKRWPAEHFIKLARLMLGDGLDRVIVIGGPEERELCEEIVHEVNESGSERAIDLSMLPLRQVPLVCRHARMIVANDTGNAHFAAASGTPVLVVCGPTDARKIKPVGQHVRAVQARSACVACYRKTCSNAVDQACMKDIRPDSIFRITQNFRLSDVAGLSISDDASSI